MKLRERLSVLPPGIIVLVFAVFMGRLCSDIIAQTPRPSVEMTQAEYNATLQHRDELVMERNTALAKENADLKKQLEDLRADGRAVNTIVATAPDMSKQVDVLNGDISSLKHQLFVARWKWAIIGTLVGIVAAIAAFLFTKAAVVVTRIAAKVGIKTALA